MLPAYHHRDERKIFASARGSGFFPRIRPSGEKREIAQKERMDKVQGVTEARRRKMQRQHVLNAQGEIDRLRSVLDSRRVFGLRNVASRIANLENVVNRINAEYPKPLA
jgi:hypothetical protein